MLTTIWFEEITDNNPNLPKNIGGKFTGTLVNKSPDKRRGHQ